MPKSFLLAGLAAAAISFGTASTASPVSIDLSFDGLAITPAEHVKIKSPLDRVVVAAGGFNMSSAHESFLAWCIDLFDHIRTATYTVERPSHVTDEAQADLNRLFSNNYDLATSTAVHSAAFQVAIWEIVYERAADYDVHSGDFEASHNGAVLAIAQDWLGTLGDEEGRYNLTFFTSGDSQDLVMGSVPLPPGLALMLSGLGVTYLAGKRRRARPE